jgi:hypothetical protein
MGAIAIAACGAAPASPAAPPSPAAPDRALGFMSCDHRPAERQCTEIASECPPERTGSAGDFEGDCVSRGFRYSDGPCPREGTTSYSEAGPGCLLTRMWMYAP